MKNMLTMTEGRRALLLAALCASLFLLVGAGCSLFQQAEVGGDAAMEEGADDGAMMEGDAGAGAEAGGAMEGSGEASADATIGGDLEGGFDDPNTELGFDQRVAVENAFEMQVDAIEDNLEGIDARVEGTAQAAEWAEIRAELVADIAAANEKIEELRDEVSGEWLQTRNETRVVVDGLIESYLEAHARFSAN